VIGAILDLPRARPAGRHGGANGLDGRFGRNRWRRVAVIGFVLFSALVVVSAAVVLVAGGRSRTSPAEGRQPVVPPTLAKPNAPAVPVAGSGLVWHTESTVVPPGTPAQEEYDQALSQGLGSQPGITAAAALAVPSPAVEGGWPSLAVARTPEQWATEFTAALLDVDYAHQSRAALGAWLQAQEAPEVIPGIPGSVADKVLYISLLDPGIFGGQPSPVPTDTGWAANAEAGTTESVSGLLVQPDPGWAQMVAAGWQPPDVRMTELDVSGILTVRSGAVTSSQNFTTQIIVGSSRWHDGFGTVAIGGWKEG
jgi:hypothetical protein